MANYDGSTGDGRMAAALFVLFGLTTQEVLLVHSNNNRLEWPTQDPVMLHNVKKAPHV